jgi:hypothetical protein
MFAQAFRVPHSLYRRYQSLFESSATAAGFAALITIILINLKVYPDNWVLVIGAAIAIVAIRWPAIAYLLAVVVLLYPIYTINLYLAVLFLAISALGHRLFVHYLGATTLVLATPLLAEYHLHWLVPILGGLWWGGKVGAWVGGLAALWGKIIGGMAGLDIDWLTMAGTSTELELIATRFQEANSLETLLLLVEPFATTSSVILYNLLQVVGWAIAGGFVGSLAGRKWVRYRTPWSILVVTAGGGIIMLAALIGLPYWLQEAASESTLAISQDPVAPLFSLLIVIIVGTILYTLRESLDLPAAPKRSFQTKQQKKKARAAAGGQPFNLFRRPAKSEHGQEAARNEKRVGDKLAKIPPRRPVRVPHQSELPEWEPPKNDSDLIMLEID